MLQTNTGFLNRSYHCSRHFEPFYSLEFEVQILNFRIRAFQKQTPFYSLPPWPAGQPPNGIASKANAIRLISLVERAWPHVVCRFRNAQIHFGIPPKTKLKRSNRSLIRIQTFHVFSRIFNEDSLSLLNGFELKAEAQVWLECLRFLRSLVGIQSSLRPLSNFETLKLKCENLSSRIFRPKSAIKISGVLFGAQKRATLSDFKTEKFPFIFRRV